MIYVLVVDDEESIRQSIQRAMRLLAPEIKVFTTPNGAAAVALLQFQNVDLVITDLLMPKMDGFELLAWLSQNQPMTPAIVMTALRSDSVEARLNTLGAGVLIQKPFDAKDLISRVRQVLEDSTRGVIKGISLGTFVQMVGLERKTCTLRISTEGRQGSLSFMNGELIAAENGRQRGLDAALDVLSWDSASIEVMPSCREQAREVDRPLEYLLMEACRLKDERPRPEATAAPESAEIARAAEPARAGRTLQEQLRGLREIEGYRGAAMMDLAGKVLASDLEDSAIDFPEVCRSASGIARGVHQIGGPAQIDGCHEMVFRSPKALLLLRCFGSAFGEHFHLLILLKPDGNRALAMVKLDALALARPK